METEQTAGKGLCRTMQACLDRHRSKLRPDSGRRLEGQSAQNGAADISGLGKPDRACSQRGTASPRVDGPTIEAYRVEPAFGPADRRSAERRPRINRRSSTSMTLRKRSWINRTSWGTGLAEEADEGRGPPGRSGPRADRRAECTDGAGRGEISLTFRTAQGIRQGSLSSRYGTTHGAGADPQSPAVYPGQKPCKNPARKPPAVQEGLAVLVGADGAAAERPAGIRAQSPVPAAKAGRRPGGSPRRRAGGQRNSCKRQSFTGNSPVWSR